MLDREGLSPRQHGAFDKERVWHLLWAYGLARERDVPDPGEDEWLLGALAKALGACREELRDWINKGWIHARRTPSRSPWIVWADAQELERLRSPLAISKPGMSKYRAYPPELLIPKRRHPG